MTAVADAVRRLARRLSVTLSCDFRGAVWLYFTSIKMKMGRLGGYAVRLRECAHRVLPLRDAVDLHDVPGPLRRRTDHCVLQKFVLEAPCCSFAL